MEDQYSLVVNDSNIYYSVIHLFAIPNLQGIILLFLMSINLPSFCICQELFWAPYYFNLQSQCLKHKIINHLPLSTYQLVLLAYIIEISLIRKVVVLSPQQFLDYLIITIIIRDGSLLYHL